MNTRRAMVSAALVSLLLSSCGDNEFPTEPIRSQRASADAHVTGAETGSQSLTPGTGALRHG